MGHSGDKIEKGNVSATMSESADGYLIVSANGVEKFKVIGEGFIFDGYLTLSEVATPSTAINKGFVYSKDDSGDTELFYLDAAGNEVQITQDGSVVGSVADKIEEGNTSVEVIDTGSDGRAIVTVEGSEAWRFANNGSLYQNGNGTVNINAIDDSASLIVSDEAGATYNVGVLIENGKGAAYTLGCATGSSGSLSSRADVADTNTLCASIAYGWLGATYRTAGLTKFAVDGTPSGSTVPTSYEVGTVDATAYGTRYKIKGDADHVWYGAGGSPSELMRLDVSTSTLIVGGVTELTYANSSIHVGGDSISPTLSVSCATSTADSSSIWLLVRSRGSHSSPSAIQSGDRIAAIYMQGVYDTDITHRRGGGVFAYATENASAFSGNGHDLQLKTVTNTTDVPHTRYHIEGNGDHVWYGASKTPIEIMKIVSSSNTINLGSATAHRVNFVAGDGASAPSITASAHSNSAYYGGNTNIMGDPVEWIDIEVNGTSRKIPCY